jgi:hypothetical protein
MFQAVGGLRRIGGFRKIGGQFRVLICIEKLMNLAGQSDSSTSNKIDPSSSSSHFTITASSPGRCAGAKWLLEGAFPGTIDPAGWVDTKAQENGFGDDAVKMLFWETPASTLRVVFVKLEATVVDEDMWVSTVNCLTRANYHEQGGPANNHSTVGKRTIDLNSTQIRNLPGQCTGMDGHHWCYVLPAAQQHSAASR